MINFKRIVVFLTALVLLSSCSSKNIQTNSMNEAESAYYTKKVGTLSEIIRKAGEKQKIFITEDNEEYYVSSKSINLSDDKVNNKKIEIYGLFIKSNSDDRDLIEIENIEISDN